jgi:hypothetical protein
MGSDRHKKDMDHKSLDRVRKTAKYNRDNLEVTPHAPRIRSRRARSRDKKRVRMYNNSKLSVARDATVVICDWDDTLFPTSWVNDNNINLTDIRSRYMYARYFDALDKHLSNTVKRIKKHGDLMIITNATRQWVLITLTVLPKTKEALDDVPIISARESFQNHCGIQEWKKYTFKAELAKEGRTHYKNIVSIGDAHYEHHALVGLYRWDVIPHKYLKSVKFTRSTDYSDLFSQIQMMGDEIKNIVRAQRHLDLTLDIVKHGE